MLRYEVAIPLLDNQGLPCTNQEVQTTLSEVAAKFHGYTFSGPTIGYWRSPEGREYVTDQPTLTIDAPDSDDSRRWFEEKKPLWTRRFRQLEFYITYHAVEVLS